MTSKSKGRVILECHICGDEYSKKLSASAKSKYCSNKCRGIAMRENTKGEKNNNWKGGITPVDHDARLTAAYQEWRLSVYTRDEFKCRKCGKKSEGDLRAHHVLSFTRYPEARTEIDNGVTLCNRCHIEFHREYGVNSFEAQDTWDYLKEITNGLNE